MERFIKSKFFKMVTVVTILFSMIATYLPTTSNAETPTIDYVVFDVACNAGNTVLSDSSIAFNYNWTLSGVQTGFKNVKLTVKDVDTASSKPLSRINLGAENKLNESTEIVNQPNGRFSTASYGSVRNGTDFSGTANVVFNKMSNFEDYQKTITFILEADYRDPIEGISQHTTIEKDVTVTVQAASEVDSFSANVNIKLNNYDSSLLGSEFQKFDAEDHLGVHYAYYNNADNYGIDKVAASYNVKINAENVCYGQYQLKLQKEKEFSFVDISDTNSEENLEVDLSRVPDVFNKEVIRNADGTVDIILTYKTKKDEYTIEDMTDAINYNFDIVVKYRIYYSFSAVAPKSSTKTLEEIAEGMVTRKSSLTNIIEIDGETFKGGFNAFKYDMRSNGANGYSKLSIYGTSGSSSAGATVTYKSDKPYFVRDHQAAGKLGNVKVASRSNLNGILLAEGEGQSSQGTIDTSISGTTASNNDEIESNETAEIIYCDENDITDEEEINKIIKIDDATEKLLTKVGSWVTITGRYTAETEGLDLIRNRNGLTIQKKSSTYTNASNCTFLSASTEGAYSSLYAGKSQPISSYINELEDNNDIKATYKSTWHIEEKRQLAEENASCMLILNYNTETGEDAFRAEGTRPIDGRTYVTENAYPTISYRVDNTATSEVVTKLIKNNIMKVNTIKINDMPLNVKDIRFYKRGEETPFWVATSEGEQFESTEDDDITEYYAIVQLKGDAGDFTGTWDTEWIINADDLKQTFNLTDENIKNIFEITRKQFGLYNRGLDSTVTYNGIANINNPDLLYDKISYLELNIGDFDTQNTNFNKENKTIELRMYKNTDVLKGADSIVYNVDPTFYVKIPDIYNFEDIKVTMPQNPYIYIKNNEIVTLNGSKYIKIECEGTYNSRILANSTISINFNRSLKDGSATQYQSINAYMITSNENYYNKVSNSEGFTYNQGTPSELYSAARGYVVEQSRVIQAISSIKDGRITYRPNSEDGVTNKPEKEYPLIAKTGKELTFIGELKNTGKALSDVTLIYKLPVKGNAGSIDLEILEEGYKFPDGNTFISKYGDVLNNPLNSNDEVNQINRLINLNNVKVYKKTNAVKTQIDPSQYTIYYSNSLTTTVDSDISEFTAYDPENSDVSNATAIMIKMNSVAKGQNITVEFTMEMPNEAGMAGAQFGAKYTQQGETSPTKLDSESVYVINGNDNGGIEVQKTFEGYAKGVAPDGINFSNIQFKLKDEDGNFVQNEGTDVVATADAQGKATFNNLQTGTYQLVEITPEALIPGYDTIGNLTYPVVEVAETTKIEVTNPRKRGTLNLQKKFEDTNEIRGAASFQITRKTVDTINFPTQTITTDAEEGKASIVGLPFGEYTVTEINGVQGYGLAAATDVTIDATTVDEYNNVTATVTNPIGRGTIVINKTVPAGQLVNVLAFQVEGLAMLTYVNTQGTEVILDRNIEIDLQLDYSEVDDIDVDISADGTTAKITLTNLPLGLYTITEKNIPSISETIPIKKYVDVTRSVQLNKDGQTENVNILNRKKVGYIQINKTAFVGEGDDAVEIGDRSNYQVQITGTSYYGTPVDKTLSFSEDGKLEVALEIGTYNVKELSTEGYNVYYTNSEGNYVLDSENNGTNVEVEFNETLNKGTIKTVNIRNNLVGVGYVRVEKSLEGVTNPQTVIDAGIKFKITGRNLAGARVEEVIDINQIDGNVAYGVSNALSIYGEYELEEVASTVPEYYEAAASRDISITMANTQASPCVERVTNTRGKGTLQMQTQTNPEGGDLHGIKYRITEVKFNPDGTYTKLDGTNGTENTVQEINGSNANNNTSFAEIQELNAGNYFVELTKIPDGYKMDQPQIVEVPSEGTGVAIFTIDKDEYIKYNRVVINKQILNKQNNILTAQEATLAQVNADESFEVKLINTENNKVYYTFVKPSAQGIIENVPAGTYEVVEEYKPRYNFYGMYNVEGGITTSAIEQNAQQKYIITVTEGTSEQASIKEITIKNKVNTDMPIGGYSQIDNYGTIAIDPTVFVTQSVVYVVDENGETLPGVEFKLVKRTITLNGENEEVVTDEEIDVGTEGNRLVSRDKRITIKGVNPESYMLVCTQVPEGYLMPKDKQIQVYSGVTQVSRVEIQEDKPRASLTLSTTYVNNSGDTKYVPLSKYKVVDKETGELVKFTRTSTGDYVKSNLEDATEVITVKSGEVEIDGLEVGTYEVGLVGVTDGYALQKDSPETVTLVENDDKHINVEVVKPKIIAIGTGYYNTMWLDSSGQLWIIGSNSYGPYGNGQTPHSYNAIPYKIKFPENNVFITSFDIGEYGVIAVDSNGRVWVWTIQNVIETGVGTSKNSLTPICLTDIDDTTIKQELIALLGEDNAGLVSSLYTAYNNGVRFKQAKFIYQDNIVLLDSEGKVWCWGSNAYQIGDGERTGDLTKLNYHPTCITDMQNNPLYDEYNLGVKIVKLAKTSDLLSGTMGAIDSAGRVWMWGSSLLGNGTTDASYTPICISNIESDFASAEIIDLVISQYAAYALDKDGNVWVWGQNMNGMLCDSNTSLNILSPTKLSRNLFDGARIKDINIKSATGLFVDEYGKVWVAGSCSSYEMGSNTSNWRQDTPYCVSDNTDLNGVEAVNIDGDTLSGHVIVLDNTGRIWAWGGNYGNGQTGAIPASSYAYYPHIVTADYIKHLEYNLKFKKIINNNSYTNTSIALDNMGNVWGIGNAQNAGFGNNNYQTLSNFTINPTLEGKNVIDIFVNDNSNDIYGALTEDGQVYIWGQPSNLYKDSYNSYYLYSPTNITSSFNITDDAKIVKVRIARQSGIAIDSKGRVYTFGTGSYYQAGNGSTSYTPPICLTTDSTNPINGKIIKDIDINENSVYAIDSDGKVWYWGNTSYGPTTETLLKTEATCQGSNVIYPVCVTNIPGTVLYDEYKNGTKFKEVYCTGLYYTYALDENGKLWVFSGSTGISGLWNNSSSDEIICINECVGHPIYNESQKYDDYKIEAISMINTNPTVFVRDNKGNCWYLDSNCVKVSEKYNVPEDLIYMNGKYAIDNYGQIWEVNEGRALSVVVNNPLYNVKIKEILNEGRVKVNSNKGEIYILNSESVTFQMYGEEYITDYLGIEIDKILKYDDLDLDNNKNNFGYQYNIVLDKQGKIWTWGGNYLVLGNGTSNGTVEPICINDISGTDLYNATQAGTKIVDFAIMSKTESSLDIKKGTQLIVVAIDNNNKVWTWGYNQGNTPICLTDINNSELNNAYNQTFSFETIYRVGQLSGKNVVTKMYAIDNSGELWSLTDEPICITKSNADVLAEKNSTGSVKDFSEFLFGMIENNKDLDCFNGKIWKRQSTTFTCLSTANEIVEVGTLNNGNFYAIDSYGKLWTWGTNNSNGQLGNGTTDAASNPVCISDIDGDLKTANVRINRVYVTGKGDNNDITQIPHNTVAVDENGDYWIWGRNTYGELGTGSIGDVLKPYKVTIMVNGQNKKIKQLEIYRSYYIINDTYINGNIGLLLLEDGTMYSAGGNDSSNSYLNAGRTISNEIISTQALAGSKNYSLSFAKISNITGVQKFDVYQEYNQTKSRAIAYGTDGAYVWGYNEYNNLGLGYNTASNVVYSIPGSSTGFIGYDLAIPTKNMDLPNNIDKTYLYPDKTYVITEDGKVYVYYKDMPSPYKPICLTTTLSVLQDVQIKDILYYSATSTSYPYFEDINGNIYYITTEKAINVSNSELLAGKTIVEKHFEGSNWVKTSDGKVYSISNGVVYDQLSTTLTGDAVGKDIIQTTPNMALDSDGNLYATGLYDSLYDYSGQNFISITDKKCSKKADFQNNQTVINAARTNELYGNKYSDIINDQIVKDTENDYWFFPSDDSIAINISDKALGEENPLYNKTIVRTIGSKYVVTSENKVYYIGGNIPTFVMEILPQSNVKDEIFYNFNGDTNPEYYCALDKQGKIWTCGNPAYGALGNGKAYQKGQVEKTLICISDIEGTSLNEKYDPDGIFKIEKIYNAGQSMYALDSEGHIWSWGYNTSTGYLGVNSTLTSVNVPICINSIDGTELCTASQSSGFKIVDLYVQNSSAYAIDSYGKLWAWGYGYAGVLGNNSTSNLITPKCISDIPDTELNTASLEAGFKIVSVEKTGDNTKLTDSNGNIWVAGRNNYGKLGTGNTNNITTFKRITGSSNYTGILNITDVDIMSDYVLLTCSNGDIYVAGNNSYGRLGTGNSSNVTSFIKIKGESNETGISNVASIQIESNYTKIIDSDGNIWIAGSNASGRFGTGDTSNITTFRKLTGESCYTGISNVIDVEITTSPNNTILKCSNGDVWIAGDNTNGKLGNGQTTNATSFIKLNDNINGSIVDVYIGSSVVFIIDSDGNIWAAGKRGGNSSRKYSLLGDGNYQPTNQTSFICVSNIPDTPLANAISNIQVVKILPTGYATFILDNNGDVWSTGDSVYNGINGTWLNVFTNLNQYEGSTLYGLKVVDIVVNNASRPYALITDGSAVCASYSVSGTNPFSDAASTVSQEKITELQTTQYIGIGAITEIIDDTHIKTSDNKIYEISDNGTFTYVDSYTPGAAPTYTEPAIPGVTVVDYSNYKALDDEGNLYVWNQYTGGFKNVGSTSTDAINISEEEYTVAPVMLDSDGWSAIRASY